MNTLVNNSRIVYLILPIIIVLFAACSGEKDLKPATGKYEDSTDITKLDSMLKDKALPSGDAAVQANPDSLNPEKKPLPLSNYLNASKNLLKWAASDRMISDLKKEVKKPEQITAFLENHITPIVKNYGFLNRFHYLFNENYYAGNKDVQKVSREIQDALDSRITPYVADSLLTDSQRKTKYELLEKLESALALMKSSRIENLVIEAMKKNRNDQSSFDRINEQVFIEAGFKSYNDALKQINEFKMDPDVQGYLMELNRVASNIVNKRSK